MPGWVWFLIAVAVIVAAAVVAWRVAVARRRTNEFRERFGPEYDRTVKAAGSRRKAEAELAARQERRDKLEIVPLETELHQRYSAQWNDVQAQFVDSPVAAVASADALVTSVMADRGYPMEAFEQRAADISVDHPEIVENYRQAHRIRLRSDEGQASTEDLRQAMQHYRSLFDELLADGASDEPPTREDTDRGTPATTTADVGDGR